MLALLLAGELTAERGLGLTDPPLFRADSAIEYLYLPNQTCQQFGHRIHLNGYSMRSGDFPARKPPGEFRVIVIGDSILDGSSRTDQADLATSILQRRLSATRPAVVGNVCAPSWGPPNQLAYVRRFGLFGADAVVLVWSSHDAADAPTFAPVVGIEPDYPDRKPPCALWQGFHRYFLGWLRHRFEPAAAPAPPPDPKAEAECAAAEGELIDLARAAGARVIVVQHAEARETGGAWQPGHEAIRAVCRAHGAEPIDDGPALKTALDAGRKVYRDHIHPTAEGQAVLAGVLYDAVTKGDSR